MYRFSILCIGLEVFWILFSWPISWLIGRILFLRDLTACLLSTLSWLPDALTLLLFAFWSTLTMGQVTKFITLAHWLSFQAMCTRCLRIRISRFKKLLDEDMLTRQRSEKLTWKETNWQQIYYLFLAVTLAQVTQWGPALSGRSLPNNLAGDFLSFEI